MTIHKIKITDIKKEECKHVLRHLQAPCGCCVTCPSGVIHLFTPPTQKHLAEHLEWDNGIEHPWDEKIEKIPVPKLVLREDLLRDIPRKTKDWKC